MGNRRKARESALQVLYQIDLSKLEPKEALRLYWESNSVPPEIEEFATLLVEGVVQNHSQLDELLEKHSIHWKLSRMACVDRNILRMAIYELMNCHDIPTTVTLNEAIEIGKKYGTEDSGAFINGILDHISKEIRPA